MRCFQLAALLVLAACSPQAAQGGPAPTGTPQAAAVHPVSGLEIIPLTVTQDGKTHRFKVEVAASEDQQRRGSCSAPRWAPTKA